MFIYCIVFACALGFASPSTSVHLALEISSPADGDTVHTVVSELRLRFTQRVELRYTAVRLRGPSGDSIAGTLEPFGDAGRDMVLRLSQPLPSGSYTAAWKTAGNDGHVVQGVIRFVVVGGPAPAPDSVAAPPVLMPGEPRLRGDLGEPVDPNLTPWAIAVRWLNFLAILLGIGAVFFQLLLDRSGELAPDAYRRSVLAAARRLAFFAAGAGIILLVPRLLLQSAALHGRERMLDVSAIVTMLRATNWGRGWMMQLAGIVALITALSTARSGSVLNWPVGMIAALLLATAPALSGHAAANERTPLLVAGEDVLHVLAAASWLGTLAYVLLAAVSRALRPPDSASSATLANLIRTFSPLALLCAAVLAITGVLSAIAHLRALSDLWSTSYGLALVIKVVLVAIVLSAGFFNWRRVKPTLGTPSATLQLRKSATFELIMAVTVVLVTSILVALPTP